MKKTVLDAGDECGLAKFLAHRGAQACLLAPAALLQDLAARAGTPGCPAVSRVDEIPADAKRVFAHDLDDEAGLLARLRAARPDLEVHGWTGLIPVLVADRRLPAPDIPLPVHRFAVVCTPRTGSTFLCELLEAGGLGAAREHLRWPLIYALRHGVPAEAAFDLVQRHGAVNGVFGTKLISHFLFDAVGQAQAGAFLQGWAQQGFRFIRLRRDPVAQTLSKYSAKHSGVWHARGALAEGRRRRLEKVSYDFAELRDIHQRTLAEDRALDEAMAGLPPERVLALDYDSVVAAPLEALARTATFLGLAAHPERVDFSALPTRLSATHDNTRQLRERFLADLAARLDPSL